MTSRVSHEYPHREMLTMTHDQTPSAHALDSVDSEAPSSSSTTNHTLLPDGPILVSACLAGRACAYDGRARAHARVLALLEENRAILVCPEAEGGLDTPRPPAEIIAGTGENVLAGQTAVRTIEGADVTQAFLFGANIAAERAAQYGCKAAILKARSPSCGKGKVYDGTFTGTLRSGDGVAAAMMVRMGLPVFTEEDF